MNVHRPTKTKLIRGYKDTHKGYDLSGRSPLDGHPFDSGVYASFDSVVVQSVNKYSSSWRNRDKLTTRDYGNYLKLKGKLFQLCAHLKKDSLLPVGTRVKKGDKIGIIGNTGNSTGPHVHVEYRHLNGVNTPVEFTLENMSKEDIRTKVLDEEGFSTEGDVRELIGSFKDLPGVRKDLDNSRKEVERLRDEYKAFKENYKGDVVAYETRVKEETKLRTDDIAAIAQDLGTGQTRPKIMEEIQRLKSEADKSEKNRQEAIKEKEAHQSTKDKLKAVREATETLRRQYNDQTKELERVNKELVIMESKMPRTQKVVSPKWTLTKEDLLKVGKGAGLSALAAVALYAADALQTLDLNGSWWAPIAISLIPVAANALRKWASESVYTK